MIDEREVWQRGPIAGVPSSLQPVAHALLQAVEDAHRYAGEFPSKLLWERPGQVASVGFHLLHIRGVIDRLFTYARAEALTTEQLQELATEKEVSVEGISASELVSRIQWQVDKAVQQLRETPQETLTDGRTLGRKQIPTTVLGLLFHAAEHSQRHIGQLLVTARFLLSQQKA